jgi:2-polyprenyl-3-methyl-5-hydroxy-6-metoxy-1,4-benzoquinol methylase
MSRPCPLCSHEPARDLFVKGGLPYKQCPACGFRFIDTRENPNLRTEMDQYEPAYVQYLEDREVDEVNFRDLLDWLGTFADLRAGPVLDVGCGSGKWVRFLRSAGVEAFGIEPADALYDAYLTGGDEFRHATASDLVAAGEPTYRVITVCDVIEHVDDVRPFAASVADLLAPGGIMLVSTPNVASLAAKLSGKFWHFYEKYHLGYFATSTLTTLLGEVGLEPVSVGCRGKRFPLGYLIRYAAEFFAGRTVPTLSPSLDRLSLYLNTHEILYGVFRKPLTPQAVVE